MNRGDVFSSVLLSPVVDDDPSPPGLEEHGAKEMTRRCNTTHHVIPDDRHRSVHMFFPMGIKGGVRLEPPGAELAEIFPRKRKANFLAGAPRTPTTFLLRGGIEDASIVRREALGTLNPCCIVVFV